MSLAFQPREIPLEIFDRRLSVLGNLDKVSVRISHVTPGLVPMIVERVVERLS